MPRCPELLERIDLGWIERWIGLRHLREGDKSAFY
jgi:hypothetical protein